MLWKRRRWREAEEAGSGVARSGPAGLVPGSGSRRVSHVRAMNALVVAART